MEFRNPNISMGIPSSFRSDQHHHPNHQDPGTKRGSRGNGDDAVLSRSPDGGQTQSYKQQQQHYTTISRSRRDLDPNATMTSEADPAGAITPTATVTRYRECQKNHAAHLGSHVVDGCGEFMPNGDQGTPESLRCAACDCHRNFHRKEISGGAAPATIFQAVPFQQAAGIQGRQASGTMMAFGGGVHAESSSEDLNLQYSSRKRFRTKFTQEQKERMMELAEKIGWRIQKQDEDEVQRFCNDSGVKRQVFKVWMHNNRQAIKRKHSD